MAADYDTDEAWNQTEFIRPFIWIGGSPHQDECVHGEPERQILRDQEHARGMVFPNKLPEVFRHGLEIVRNQNATVSSGFHQNFGIRNTMEPSGLRASEVDGWFTPDEGTHDGLIEVIVRLEAYPHRLRKRSGLTAGEFKARL